jgi:NADH-quinone oxidoreductase subunit N
MSYLEILRTAAPETVIVLTALAVLAADLMALHELEIRFRLLIGAMISCAGCLIAIGWMLVLPQHADLSGMLVVGPVTQLVKVALLLQVLFTILLSIESDFTTHSGEYFALILLAAAGMMFLISAQDILMIFISLELTSLSLYILTAFNKRNVKSGEAALKYFLFGGMTAAFTLFGLSWLYGITGSTNLVEIAQGVAEKGVQMVHHSDGTVTRSLDPLVVGAIVMTVIGFGFKVAAVPFHLWAPDAYEGAPTPSAALIASGSKLASFFIFAKVMMIGFRGVEGVATWGEYLPGWVPVLAVISAASMVLGNLAAIVQRSVRRLLAYSAIAHGGYMLLAVMAHHGDSLNALIYYAVTYGFTVVGAFGVVSLVQQQIGSDELEAFTGLSRRAPLLSFCMMIFMLSLAGIPPLAGFFGKFFVFASVLGAGPQSLGPLWLVALALAMSAVSLYYYLQVLKRIYVGEQEPSAQGQAFPVLTQVVLVVLAIIVVLLGCAPGLLVGPLTNAIRVAGL